MTISVSDLPTGQITNNIKSLLSKVKRNSSNVKKNISLGLSIDKNNSDVRRDIIKKRASINEIALMSVREYKDVAEKSKGFISLVESMKKREKGGPITSGQSYLVGEKGPEMIVPSVSGQVITNNNIRSIEQDRGISTLNTHTRSGKKVLIQPIIIDNTHTEILR